MENSNRISDKITKEHLMKMIRDDLENFSHILSSYAVGRDKSHKQFDKDDKGLILQNLKDKVKVFSSAIINCQKDYFKKIKSLNRLLYKEIKKDFKDNKIKQRNIIKCFTLMYPDEKNLHSRTLMVELRHIEENNDFFKTSNLEIGAAGLKYFKLPSC